jgi:hypothetical protein
MSKWTCSSMYPHVSVWIHVGPCGSTWPCMLLWIHVDPHRSMWIHVDPCGSMWSCMLLWTHMDPHGFMWIHMDPCGSMWSCMLLWIHMDPHGSTWIHVDPCGLAPSCIHMESCGPTCAHNPGGLEMVHLQWWPGCLCEPSSWWAAVSWRWTQWCRRRRLFSVRNAVLGYRHASHHHTCALVAAANSLQGPTQANPCCTGIWPFMSIRPFQNGPVW